MFIYVLPIVLIVASNVVYNVCQKSTPQSANPFSALLITYLTAAILTLIASTFYKTDKGFLQSFNELNWTSVALGVAIVLQRRICVNSDSRSCVLYSRINPYK